MRLIFGVLFLIAAITAAIVAVELVVLLERASATTYGPFPSIVPPDTIDVTMPTMGFNMSGVAVPPASCPTGPIVSLAPTDTLEWVLWRGPADTVAVITALPGARATFGVPTNWPPTTTQVFGAVRKKRTGQIIVTSGGAVCQSDTYLLRGPMMIVWPMGVGAPTPR